MREEKRKTRLPALAALALLLTTCGGGQKPAKRPEHVCFAETKTALRENEVRSFWSEDWFDLLLSSFDRYSKIPDKNPLLCTKAELSWPEPQTCLVHEAEVTRLEREVVSEKNLVFTQLTKSKRLVWAITHRFDNGEALGAVAISEFTPDGVIIHAIGPLRAPGQRVRMKLEKTAEGNVLLVEGQLCPEDSESACPRFVRAMLLADNRFLAIPLTNKSGDCQGPAYFPLARNQEKQLDDGEVRKYVLSSTVDVNAQGIVVHEQLSVHDVDPKQAETPPRLRRRAEIDRQIRIVTGRFIPESASLWHRVEVETGTVPSMTSRDSELLSPALSPPP